MYKVAKKTFSLPTQASDRAKTMTPELGKKRTLQPILEVRKPKKEVANKPQARARLAGMKQALLNRKQNEKG